MPDLPDLDRAVESAVRGIFDNAGQVCNAGSRLLVHAAMADEFIAAFTRKTAELYLPGDPLDPATTMGPLVSRGQQDKVLHWIETGIAEGACLEFGGVEPASCAGGAFVAPTLFSGVTPPMAIGREEIFGPVASLFTFESEAEAIALANDSIYGLAASVWTADLTRAHRMIKAIEAGVVWVNCFGDGDMSQPFGGYKQSGNTRDKSLESLAGYMQSKSSWISLS
jgi:gamma-glutamyl-gamma-aminobutyraldehyde dehydrogenase